MAAPMPAPVRRTCYHCGDTTGGCRFMEFEFFAMPPKGERVKRPKGPKKPKGGIRCGGGAAKETNAGEKAGRKKKAITGFFKRAWEGVRAAAHRVVGL